MQSLIKKFYEEKSPQQIGDTTIRLFEIIYSSDDPLASIRKKKYEHMVLSNRAVIDPSILPPSSRAAYYHGLRVYHQMKVWRQLRDSDLMPLKLGWQKIGESLSPIMKDIEAGPTDLLKVIRCGCKGMCDNQGGHSIFFQNSSTYQYI